MWLRAYLIVSGLVFTHATWAVAPDGFQTGCVLLQNGNVFRGQVQESKDRVTVVIDGNSRIALDRKQVACVADTLESLYQHQRAGIRVWGIGEHWHLANWCIQQGLLERAIEHYKVLEAQAPDSTQFKTLEHQLREALIKHHQVKQPAKTVASETNETSSPKQEPELAENSASVQRASGRIHWSTHDIPGYIRKSFQLTVLPVLVTRCGQSGCHGLLGKTDFHIYQPVGDQSATILADDLEAVLRYINRDRVQDSQLMAYATRAHGIQRHPSLNPAREDERTHIERINAWAKSLALSQRPDSVMPAVYPVNKETDSLQSKNSVTPATANMPLPRSGRLSLSDLRRPEENPDRDAKLSKPAKSAPQLFLTGSEISDLESMIDQLDKKYTTSDESSSRTKKDPFDPDLFNKKFR